MFLLFLWLPCQLNLTGHISDLKDELLAPVVKMEPVILFVNMCVIGKKP